MQNTFVLILMFTCLLIPSWLLAKEVVPGLVLAKHFNGQMEHPFYWVSEKLDGIRCYWDGQSLQTRAGNTIYAPDWFTRGFPNTPLDGELWIARGTFQLLSKIVLDKQPDTQLWNQVSFQVFDLPNSDAPFEIRQDLIKNLVKQQNLSHLQWVQQRKMTSLADIKEHFRTVVKQGAEGLMLRTPEGLYHAGRSDTLLKMKQRDDAEARVIAYQAGRGKFENMMGAIWVETQEGKLFKIGSGFSHEERKNPPPIGSEITYSYQGYTDKGLPRFASFVRVKPQE
jgi:DNA ligase-1